MPLYEGRHNAVNTIRISDAARDGIVLGTDRTVDRIAERIQELGPDAKVALDGWYGVDFETVLGKLCVELSCRGLTAEVVPTYRLFCSEEKQAAYRKTYLTDDPGFGHVNSEGRIRDIMDSDHVFELSTRLRSPGIVVVYGYGAAIPELSDQYSAIYYFDKTRQPLLWEMWDGQIVPFGRSEPRPDYHWKEYYYCDYYLLHFQKEHALDIMEAYIEAIDSHDLKLLPRASYDEIVTRMLEYPVKEVQIYQPGPWGAYRYKDLWDIPGLECNAWNELAGPELSILIDVGISAPLNIPFVNLMQYPEKLVGEYIAMNYPHLFPLDVWLDDGYFPEPTPAERISMPIHNHPSTDYVRAHFNEPLGRYETYYITEAYEGANTWMGFRSDADLEDWERRCRESNNQKPIEGWKDVVSNWESVVGDLYLIPPGTDHAHGGNQMVLEMDTCPSIAGTEYSFFSFDFARNSWDDATKTMSGRPMKMHLEHSFANSKWRREDYVNEKLRAKPRVVKWTKGYSMERYSSVPEMPFEIERLHFYECAEYTTDGRFMHIATLTVGSCVRIASTANPERSSEIDLFQSVVIPASFGSYEVRNESTGFCTLVILRWKIG
jgi:hypothetical protein